MIIIYLQPIALTFLAKVLATANLTFGTLSDDKLIKFGNISLENLAPVIAPLQIKCAQRRA